ncbi:hypothetical protein XccvBFoX7_gp66c [Xanthomonas phage FoX7]|uniref:Uncharacterized protein n=2 Tax=Carpasinavirus XcP1 TaxID=2182344 RepID=A0A858NRC4_9CAUD|nr:hypothetical protein XccvBFoX6_gp66c [Xanthomonas phage FoX6]QJB22223.1 hypothetical protein XccvBFoX7_gp66c [Xanthomonas phage FoX7]
MKAQQAIEKANQLANEAMRVKPEIGKPLGVSFQASPKVRITAQRFGISVRFGINGVWKSKEKAILAMTDQ